MRAQAAKNLVRGSTSKVRTPASESKEESEDSDEASQDERRADSAKSPIRASPRVKVLLQLHLFNPHATHLLNLMQNFLDSYLS